MVDGSGLREDWLGDIITLEHMFLEKAVMSLSGCYSLLLIETDWLNTIIRSFNGIVNALSAFHISWSWYLWSGHD